MPINSDQNFKNNIIKTIFTLLQYSVLYRRLTITTDQGNFFKKNLLCFVLFFLFFGRGLFILIYTELQYTMSRLCKDVYAIDA